VSGGLKVQSMDVRIGDGTSAGGSEESTQGCTTASFRSDTMAISNCPNERSLPDGGGAGCGAPPQEGFISATIPIRTAELSSWLNTSR